MRASVFRAFLWPEDLATAARQLVRESLPCSGSGRSEYALTVSHSAPSSWSVWIPSLNNRSMILPLSFTEIILFKTKTYVSTVSHICHKRWLSDNEKSKCYYFIIHCCSRIAPEFVINKLREVLKAANTKGDFLIESEDLNQYWTRDTVFTSCLPT